MIGILGILSILLNLISFLVILTIFIYAMSHIPVREKINMVLRKRLKWISIGAFVVYWFTVYTPLVLEVMQYHAHRRGETLSPVAEWICDESWYIWFLFLFALWFGLSNICIYSIRNKRKK